MFGVLSRVIIKTSVTFKRAVLSMVPVFILCASVGISVFLAEEILL